MSEEVKGPLLTMLIFCEKALQETDSVFTAVRIVDNLQIAILKDIPEDTRFLIQPWMVIKFSSYKLAAKKHLQLVSLAPSGEETKLFKEPVPVFFEADQLGVNVRVEATMGLKTEGVYWFRVYLDDEFMGECPLRLSLQKRQSATDEQKK